MPNINYGVIPDNWNLICYASRPEVPQYAFIDEVVKHGGNPSIRLDKGGGYDVIHPTLLDRAIWLKGRIPAKVGDHIQFSVYIKMASYPGADGNPNWGGRFGIDGYKNGVNIAPQGEVFQSDYVPWGSDWTLRGVDVVIPEGYTLDHILPWFQCRPGEAPYSGWFADCEFYVNREIITECAAAADCQAKYGDAPEGYHWECQNGNCAEVKDKPYELSPLHSLIFRNTQTVSYQCCQTLRNKLISEELHKKLHPLV